MKSNSKKQNPRQRHVPERSCIACREKKSKRDLIRLVSSTGFVEIDLKGKGAGRGVYLCPMRECWETGLKGNRLEHALQAKLASENRQVLVEYGQNLPRKRENHS
ncbi:MAG: YlxR family protein [Chloroflexota bacterium]|nr:MAG: YlxR family protein [Chloroflexota bacterium]